jgi:hypothetical protein
MLVSSVTPALARQITELDATFRRPLMQATTDDDHSPLACRSHSVQQAIGKNEVAEMVHDELLLEPVHLFEPPENDTSVENQHVDGGVHLLDLSRAGDH